jgi:hypothetical protein
MGICGLLRQGQRVNAVPLRASRKPTRAPFSNALYALRFRLLRHAPQLAAESRPAEDASLRSGYGSPLKRGPLNVQHRIE